MRTCSECKEKMVEGYCIYDGLEYYCSDECLLKHYTKEENFEMYEDGNSYWTEWEDEEEGIVISTYDDMKIVVRDNVYYHETESDSKPLELVALVNAPYHSEDDHLSGTFNFGETEIDIYFDVSAEGDENGLYYYFIYKEGNGNSDGTEPADLIYEYETKIAKAKRNNDTETQYYYQDKLNELLRGKGERK